MESDTILVALVKSYDGDYSQYLLVALTILYDGNRSIRRSSYNGDQYGAVLVAIAILYRTMEIVHDTVLAASSRCVAIRALQSGVVFEK